MRVSTLEPSLLKDGPNPALQPDFKIYTGAMEADPNRENVVRMIGSSTERDLQGDTMALSALTDMAQVDPGGLRSSFCTSCPLSGQSLVSLPISGHGSRMPSGASLKGH